MDTERQRNLRHLVFASSVLGTLLLTFGCATPPRTAAPPTPQRPTFSNNTSTTAVDTVELEGGALFDPNDKFDSPVLLKWGMGEHSELFAGWSPYVYIRRPGPDSSGPGDVLIGTRHRVVDEDEHRPAGAIQLQTKLPAADRTEGLGTGEIDFFAAGIVDKTFGDVAVTGFYQFGLLGEPGTGGVDPQHALAIAAVVGVDDRVDVFGELATVIYEDRASLFTIVGGAYRVNRGLTLDIGASIGLDDDAPAFELLVGFTQNFGALFGGGSGQGGAEMQ